MTDPNANATAQSVTDSLAGTDGNGNGLSYREVAMLFPEHMFGISKDYAFAEDSNTTFSVLDIITTLGKIYTPTQKLADGNTYCGADCLFTITKWILSQNLHINDDEVNSVNYKAPAA